PILLHTSSHFSLVYSFRLSADHRALHSFPTRRSSDLGPRPVARWEAGMRRIPELAARLVARLDQDEEEALRRKPWATGCGDACRDRKSTRLNSSHGSISYAVFCLKKKKRRNSTYR